MKQVSSGIPPEEYKLYVPAFPGRGFGFSSVQKGTFAIDDINFDVSVKEHHAEIEATYTSEADAANAFQRLRTVFARVALQYRFDVSIPSELQKLQTVPPAIPNDVPKELLEGLPDFQFLFTDAVVYPNHKQVFMHSGTHVAGYIGIDTAKFLDALSATAPRATAPTTSSLLFGSWAYARATHWGDPGFSLILAVVALEVLCERCKVSPSLQAAISQLQKLVDDLEGLNSSEVRRLKSLLGEAKRESTGEAIRRSVKEALYSGDSVAPEGLPLKDAEDCLEKMDAVYKARSGLVHASKLHPDSQYGIEDLKVFALAALKALLVARFAAVG